MNELGQQLKERWIAAGTPHRVGVTEQDILAFEARYGVRMPAVLRDFFLTVNGTNGGSDELLLEFLPLENVKPISADLINFRGIPDYGVLESTLGELDSWFVLIDYLITSHVYAVQLTSTGTDPAPVLWICGGRYYEIAPSFVAFLQAYLADPASVLFPAEVR